MGNCVCAASVRPVEPWTDDDGDGDGELAGTSPGQAGSGGEARTGVEVTIRISRRRLQELMAEAAGGEGMTVEKVLAEIVGADEVVDRHRRRWRPALHSIPEVAVES
ncbi:hypothetical protein ACP70R_040409 [Stipagrostis hirtigluma subsp. patula]